ncbi:Retrotransposon-derived protein PEG10 [Rhizoctonia solani]|uniref:Retrotransposon-derived protein PEG10 n=1 Tax=Rhizoctonia solani TaxID=456999 RepID=A0A8H8T341_9AGAM|nr:Retrotransposon-derived protein PEG10 [Rhizoctonia solani]QRW26218.1 Retrotransposon-derived protein PEG10 [Rhizoctonia solani]
MATRSRLPSQACSPVNQGQLEAFLLPTSPELGKVSLKQVINLLWGLQGQIDRIEQTLLEQTKISEEVQTNVENILQTVNTVKDGLAQLQLTQGPHIPEEQKPLAVEETPRAAPKAKPIGQAQPPLGAPAPIISTGAPRRNPLSFFSPCPSLSFPSGPAPAAPMVPPAIPAAPATAPQATPALPPARSTVKVDHPDAFKGKIGLEAKQWLTCKLAWVCLNQGQFPLDLETLSFLLMNMMEAAGAWAHPHLDQLGSHHALIQTVDEFKTKFLAACGNPDATQAAERKITSLTQTSTCAKYITKFCTLQMELDWNDAALCGQFAQGLHWEVQKQIATRERQPRTLRELQDAALIIDNALREERASHPPQGSKSGKSSTTPNWGASTDQQATTTGPLSSDPNYVLEEECNSCRAEGLCVKCSKPGHKFAKCWTRWKATPKEDEGKAKETAKIGKDSKYQLGKE